MSNSPRFFVAEHLWSDYNKRRCAAGQDNQPLLPGSRRLASELVRQQFGEFLRFVDRSRLSRVVAYAPTTRRHRESAEIGFGGLGIRMFLDPRLNPVDVGKFAGRKRDDIRKEGGILRFLDEPYPGGECYREVALRFGGFLEDVCARHPPDTIVLIAGAAGSTRQLLAHHLYNLDLDEVLLKSHFYRADNQHRCGCHRSWAPFARTSTADCPIHEVVE